MKNSIKLTSVLSLATAMLSLYSCSKSNSVAPTAPGETNATVTGHHTYGVIAPTAESLVGVPVFDIAAFKAAHQMDALKVGASVVTLATPAVRDQGSLGSCTGFAGTEDNEIAIYYKTGSWSPVLSPAFLYYEERVNIQKQKITADNGAQMVNIGQALSKYGESTEALYAYPASDKSTAYKTAPGAAAISNALNYKVSSYTLINTGDTAAVKTALRANVPVLFGFNVYDNTKYTIFEGLNTTSYTYSPLTSTGALVKGVSLLGGHANVIIGYDDTRAAFKVINSWSTTWGLNGFYYLPYSVFSSTKIVPQGGVFTLTL